MWVVWFLLRPLSLASDHIPSLCPHMVRVFSSCSGQGLLSSCGTCTSHGDGFSHCRAWALGYVGLVVAVPGLQSTGSVVVEHGLRCFAHVGSSWTGRDSMSPARAGGFLVTEPPAKPPFVYFCLCVYCLRRLGEGNGNPLQYSCLENPMGGGAW